MAFGPYSTVKRLQLYPMLSYVSAWEAARDASRYVLVAANGVAAHAQHEINASLRRDAEAAARARPEVWTPIEFVNGGSDVGCAVWKLPSPSAATLEGLLQAVTGQGSCLPVVSTQSTTSLTDQLRESLRQSTSHRAILPLAAAVHLGAELIKALRDAVRTEGDFAPDLTTGSITVGRDGAVHILPPLTAVRAAEESSWTGQEFRFGVGLLASGRGERAVANLVAAVVREWLTPPSTKGPYRHDGSLNNPALRAALEPMIQTLGPRDLDPFASELNALDQSSGGAEALAHFVCAHWERIPPDARWG